MRVVGLLLLLVAATGELFAAEKGPVRLRIVPADALIAPNSTLQYKATLSFIGGSNSPAAQRDVTIRVHWFSSDTSVATINPASGMASSTNKSGTTTITAASGPFTASVPLTVSTATLTAISVAPSPASVPLGLVQQFIATGNYNNSTQHDLTSAAMWNSSVTSVATINTFGLAMSHVQGPTTISAQFGGKAGSATLSVTAPILERIFVSPQNPNLVFPASLQLAATGIYSDASTKDLSGNATWTSGAPPIASISASGLASGKSVGSANITAASGAFSGSTLLTVSGDPLGTVPDAAIIDCPAGGLSGGVCYSLTVTCPGIADQNVLVKMIPASGAPKGTVIFIGGGGSSGGFFDYLQSEGGYIYGQYIVSSLTQNGYTAASLDFNDPIMGWLTGPGGMRRLACRPATVIHWVYDHIHQGGTSAPLCTATESGGSTAVADGLSHYGLGSILSMTEAAGGPPLTHLDHGCACDQGPSVGPCSPQPISPCYDPTDVFPIVDAAYFPETLCADAYSGDISVLPQLQFDSVLSGADTLFSFPTTDVHVLIGGRDLSTAATEGIDWEQSITSKHSLACVATSGHSMPSFIDAANQIISDIINYCKVQ